jgi:hypothetical protein
VSFSADIEHTECAGVFFAGTTLPHCGPGSCARIERIRVTGRIHEITEEFSLYFLDVLPPKIHGGWWFAFADGQEPLTIFWQSAGKRYCRRLTDDETARLCNASGLPPDYGLS